MQDSSIIVAECCKFLIKFCRSSRQNQRAVFDQLKFLLDHSTASALCYFFTDLIYRLYVALACISLKGSSCCLCVATAALKDSQENALALKEANIDRIVFLLSAAGTLSQTFTTSSLLDSTFA